GTAPPPPAPRRRSLSHLTVSAAREASPLSLHDALPISRRRERPGQRASWTHCRHRRRDEPRASAGGAQSRWQGEPWCRQRRRGRSEEHTSELQSRENLVCRLLLEKKKQTTRQPV